MVFFPQLLGRDMRIIILSFLNKTLFKNNDLLTNISFKFFFHGILLCIFETNWNLCLFKNIIRRDVKSFVRHNIRKFKRLSGCAKQHNADIEIKIMIFYWVTDEMCEQSATYILSRNNVTLCCLKKQPPIRATNNRK